MKCSKTYGEASLIFPFFSLTVFRLILPPIYINNSRSFCLYTKQIYTIFTPKCMLSSTDLLVTLLHSLKTLAPDSQSYSLPEPFYYSILSDCNTHLLINVVCYYFIQSSLQLYSPIHSHCPFITTILSSFFFWPSLDSMVVYHNNSLEKSLKFFNLSSFVIYFQKSSDTMNLSFTISLPTPKQKNMQEDFLVKFFKCVITNVKQPLSVKLLSYYISPVNSFSHFLKWMFHVICCPYSSYTSSPMAGDLISYVTEKIEAISKTFIYLLITKSIHSLALFFPLSTKANSFTSHLILFPIFCLLQDFLLELIPFPCINDLLQYIKTKVRSLALYSTQTLDPFCDIRKIRKQ